MKEISIIQTKDLVGTTVELFGWVSNRRDERFNVHVEQAIEVSGYNMDPILLVEENKANAARVGFVYSLNSEFLQECPFSF